MCEADGGWGEIEKTRREDEDEREKVQLKNQLCPCTLLENTKMSLVASIGMFRLSGQRKWTTGTNFVNGGKM